MKQNNGDRAHQQPGVGDADVNIVESIEALMDETLPQPLPVSSRKAPRYRTRVVWWMPTTWVGPMSEISEKTRVGLTIGGAAVLIAMVFGMGQLWGDWRATNRARDATIARHDDDIKELRTAFVQMQGTLVEIKVAQDTSRESTNATVRNTTHLIDKIGQLEVALASRGMRVPSSQGD